MSDERGALGSVRLGAYVDGELDQQRRCEVEALLARSPADAARLAALRRQGRALRAGAPTMIGESRPQLAGLVHTYRRRRRRLWLAAAATVLLVLAGSGAWLADVMVRPAADLAEMARDAEAAYRVHVAEPAGAAQPEDPARVGRVASRLSDRLGRHIPVPDLGHWGFRLVGDALLATDGGPAVQLVYADGSGRRISCLFRLRAVTGDAALSYREAGDVVTAYGADSDLGYAMSGRMPRRELASIADEVYGREDP